MIALLLFHLSVPLALRFLSKKPLYTRAIGFTEDVFIALEVLLLGSISAVFMWFIGFLVHLYLIFDACLFSQIQLRMRLAFLSQLRHPHSLLDSAKALGLNRFLLMGAALLLSHLLAYFFLDQNLKAPWILFLIAAPVAGIGASILPKSLAYAVNNPLFEEQIARLKRLFSQKKSFSPKKDFLSSVFSGPKQFELKVDPGEKPHIILLFLESFSAHSVGCIGNQKGATPHFDRMAQEGILFRNFYSNGTMSYHALLSGLFGLPPGGSSDGLAPYLDVPLYGLPQLLKKEGYKTAFHHNGSLSYDKQREFLQKHFDSIADRNEIGESSSNATSWGVHDEYLMEYSAKWLEKQNDPTFMTLFTISNHHPWILPEYYQAPVFEFPPNSPKQRFLRALHYSDSALALFIDLLKAKNLSQKTIFFILGDHGQAMGEHQSNFYHFQHIYEGNIHIPLLILAEGRIQQPKVIEDLGSQSDLLSTIMDLLQIKGFQHGAGSSLMRKIPDRKIWLQNPYSEHYIGCRTGNWKWIENRTSQKGELYDLSVDPEERNNLEKVHPNVSESLRDETTQFFEGLNELYQRKSIASFPPASLDLDFSNSFLTDEKIIAATSSQIERMNLENCLLLTDAGIAALLSKCPNLEELNLKGITDLTDLAFEKPHKKLRSLDISDARQISDRGIHHLARSCPSLTAFFFQCGKRV